MGSDVIKLVSSTEVKMTSFLAKRNLSFVTVDYLGLLYRNIFPELKIVLTISCGKTCILNRAITSDLQETLVNQMKTTCFSIATDGSNYQKLKEMNPLTLRIFDRNQHKVVTKFFDMCKSREANQKRFSSPLTLQCLNAMFPGINVFHWV